MQLVSVSLFLFIALSAAPITYELDPAKTELLALTTPAGIPGASHPHAIVATRVTGKIVYDAAAPENSSVTLSFPSVVGRNGCMQVLDPPLSKDERLGLDKSVETLRKAQERVG